MENALMKSNRVRDHVKQDKSFGNKLTEKN